MPNSFFKDETPDNWDNYDNTNKLDLLEPYIIVSKLFQSVNEDSRSIIFTY